MIKATYVTRYTNSRLQIRFQGGLPLRLFGGLFLLGGSYFLYPGPGIGGQIAAMLGLPLKDKTETVNEAEFAEESEG